MPSAFEARQGLIDLTAIAQRDLRAIWDRISDLPADEIRDILMEILPAIGDEYGSAAAALAADWYDEAREAAEVAGSFRAAPAKPVTPRRWEALTRWGVDPLYSATPDANAALTLILGGLQRTVADRHRLTIVDNSIHDPEASGWTRVGVGENCDFCTMLIGRGAVYTEASVTFRSHDHCNCAASPSWAKNVVKISGEPFRQSKRNRSDATKAKDNARAKEWIAANLH